MVSNGMERGSYSRVAFIGFQLCAVFKRFNSDDAMHEQVKSRQQKGNNEKMPHDGALE